MKTDLFQSCGPCSVFQICWHIECSTLTASSFRILSSSAAITSPLLAMFVEMLPKAHLTSHSRMSGSKWVTKPSWLSESLIPFLYSSSVYSCLVFLIPSASVRSLQFILLCPPLHEIFPWYLQCSWWNVYSLSHSIAFLYFFALFIEEGLLVSPCYSL